MKKIILLIIFRLGMALLSSDKLCAQSDVTFQVNITHLRSNTFKLKVTFPMSMENSQLEYQFRAMINNRYRNEDISRSLRITSDDETLDSLYFNSYAW